MLCHDIGEKYFPKNPRQRFKSNNRPIINDLDRAVGLDEELLNEIYICYNLWNFYNFMFVFSIFLSDNSRTKTRPQCHNSYSRYMETRMYAQGVRMPIITFNYCYSHCDNIQAKFIHRFFNNFHHRQLRFYSRNCIKTLAHYTRYCKNVVTFHTHFNYLPQLRRFFQQFYIQATIFTMII